MDHFWTVSDGIKNFNSTPSCFRRISISCSDPRHVQVHLLHSDQKPHMQFFGPGQVPGPTDLPLS